MPPGEYLKKMIGDLAAQVAMLMAERDQLSAERDRLKDEVAKLTPPPAATA